jgi:hypothetical protein
VLQLEVILERPDATWFRLGDGTEVHVYGLGTRTAASTLSRSEPTGAHGSISAAPTETFTRSSDQMIRARSR